MARGQLDRQHLAPWYVSGWLQNLKRAVDSLDQKPIPKSCFHIDR